MNTELHFLVPNLSCGHCVAAVTRAMAALGASVQVDLAAKTVRVQPPAALTEAQVRDALQAAGYPPA